MRISYLMSMGFGLISGLVCAQMPESLAPDRRELDVHCAGGTVHNNEWYTFCEVITGEDAKSVVTRWACRCLLAQALCRSDNEEVIHKGKQCVAQPMMNYMYLNRYPEGVEYDNELLYAEMKQRYEEARDVLFREISASVSLKDDSKQLLKESISDVFEGEVALLGVSRRMIKRRRGYGYRRLGMSGARGLPEMHRTERVPFGRHAVNT